MNGKAIIVFIGIYLFHILAMAYTEDQGEGITDLSNKLSLLLFPLLLGTVQPIVSGQYRRVLDLFCAGTFVALIIGFISSAINYADSGIIQEFYTHRFSPVHHPSYLALYMNLALCILGVRFFEQGKAKFRQTFIAIGMLILTLCLVFPASKMGFINFVLLVVFLLFMAWRKKRLFSKNSLYLVVLLVSFFGFLKLNTVASGRVTQAIQVTTNNSQNTEVAPKKTETTEARKTVWMLAIEEIKDNPLGVGTGDIGDVMNQAYLKKGYVDLAEKELNPHNSFLQLALALGIPAVLWFLFSLIFPIKQILRNGQWVFAFFLLSIVLNFMVESMLEKQSGVIFFGFFNAFFFFLFVQKNQKEAIK